MLWVTIALIAYFFMGFWAVCLAIVTCVLRLDRSLSRRGMVVILCFWLPILAVHSGDRFPVWVERYAEKVND